MLELGELIKKNIKEPNELWEILEEMSLNEPTIHAVFDYMKIFKLTREHAAIFLAVNLAEKLLYTQKLILDCKLKCPILPPETYQELNINIDIPPYAFCSVCGRKTWTKENIGKKCNMPQPTGQKCPGIFIV